MRASRDSAVRAGGGSPGGRGPRRGSSGRSGPVPPVRRRRWLRARLSSSTAAEWRGPSPLAFQRQEADSSAPSIQRNSSENSRQSMIGQRLAEIHVSGRRSPWASMTRPGRHAPPRQAERGQHAVAARTSPRPARRGRLPAGSQRSRSYSSMCPAAARGSLRAISGARACSMWKAARRPPRPRSCAGVAARRASSASNSQSAGSRRIWTSQSTACPARRHAGGHRRRRQRHHLQVHRRRQPAVSRSSSSQ